MQGGGGMIAYPRVPEWVGGLVYAGVLPSAACVGMTAEETAHEHRVRVVQELHLLGRWHIIQACQKHELPQSQALPNRKCTLQLKTDI